jgi:hypothetical protein
MPLSRGAWSVILMVAGLGRDSIRPQAEALSRTGVTGVPTYVPFESQDHIAANVGGDRREYRLRHPFTDGNKMLNGQALTNASI